MTVYVDDFGIQARVGHLNARWSHLIADSREELHAFAQRLGLRRSWFQDPVVNGKHPRPRPGSRAAENWHYDVTESKRQLALKLGATGISWRDLTDVINARIAASAASGPNGTPESAPCARKPGHSGMCMTRCTKTPGCTDPDRHRGSCTTGGYRNFGWAGPDDVACGRANRHLE